MARAITGIGGPDHVEELVEIVSAGIPYDIVTVTRYSATRPPQFVSHRHFFDRMVELYLSEYYAFDPFHAGWQQDRLKGVVPLKSLAGGQSRRGRYIAEFLAQSHICDEVGVLLPDGGDYCLGIFLDRSTSRFRAAEITTLQERLPVIEAIHESDVKSRRVLANGAGSPTTAGEARHPTLPDALWPELSVRERELVELILSGYQTQDIAAKLGIAAGTAKNHRRKIYQKLDITTERELFLQYFNFLI